MIPKELKRVEFSQVVTKTRLQKNCYRFAECGDQYQVVSEVSPTHAKEFEVFVNGQTMGHGHGRSRN